MKKTLIGLGVCIFFSSCSEQKANQIIQIISSQPNVTSNPVTSNPVTSNPVTSNPVTSNPVTSNPVTSNPVTSNPVTSNPVTSNPVTSNPVTSNPVTSNPVTSIPSNNETFTLEIQGIGSSGEGLIRGTDNFITLSTPDGSYSKSVTNESTSIIKYFIYTNVPFTESLIVSGDKVMWGNGSLGTFSVEFNPQKMSSVFREDSWGRKVKVIKINIGCIKATEPLGKLTHKCSVN